MRRSDSGFALIEVVVSAAVLIIVVTGVLAAMDSVSSTAGANKARTVAATLAEADQERMRAMKTVAISGYQNTSTVPSGNVTYTVESKAEWIRDATGETVSCTSAEGQISYLRITSKVTSPVTTQAVKPVVMSSLVAPPAGALGTQGTLAVSVKNASGGPVVNLPVALSGTASRSGVTNQEGCVVFSLIPAGTYAVTLDSAGWVDRTGTRRSVRTGVSVTAGNVSTVAMEYDRATGVTLEVETKPFGAAVRPDPSTGILAANTGIPPSGFLVLTPSGGSASTINVTGLFPFPDPYTFYSGTCEGNDPSLPEHTPSYFDTNPGSLRLLPGVPGGTVKIREPALNVRVTRGTTLATATPYAAHAVITPKTPGCSTAKIVATVTSAGVLQNPGLPFGKYDICVDDNDRRPIWARDVVLGNPDGSPQIPLYIPRSGTRTSNCSET